MAGTIRRPFWCCKASVSTISFRLCRRNGIRGPDSIFTEDRPERCTIDFPTTKNIGRRSGGMRQCRVEIPKRKLKGSHREFVETDAPARPEIPSTKKEERRTMNTKSVANFRCAVFLKLWFLILLLGISGCVSTSFRKPPPPYSGANAFQKVYVYSFVDIREKEIGPNFMVELERAFGEALTQSGVTSEQLWFLKSPYAADYSLQQTPTGAQKGTTR